MSLHSFLSSLFCFLSFPPSLLPPCIDRLIILTYLLTYLSTLRVPESAAQCPCTHACIQPARTLAVPVSVPCPSGSKSKAPSGPHPPGQGNPGPRVSVTVAAGVSAWSDPGPCRIKLLFMYAVHMYSVDLLLPCTTQGRATCGEDLVWDGEPVTTCSSVCTWNLLDR